MASSRFFVTNLPTDTTEDDLRSLFDKYGQIDLIDLKTKENVLDPGNVNVFAFVTLKISAEDAEYYLNELKWQKLRGAKLKISIAKESFLERLKRERAENDASETSITNGHAKIENSDVLRNELIPENVQNTRRVFNFNDDDDDDDIDDDEIAPDLLITKKRAARSLQNGKIVIEESGAMPLHVIERPKKSKSASKATTAEQKRKESLHKMKNQYDQQKNAIQAALTGLNGVVAKKIKFSDAEEENELSISKVEKKKAKIFGSDDEAGDEDINTLKIEYGKKGEKLAKLQSENQNVDARFRLDGKFVDEEDDDDDAVDNKVEDNEDDERKWQLDILEQVVGHKLNTETAAQKAAKNKKMLRFDPSKAEHDKFLRPTANEAAANLTNVKKKLSTEAIDSAEQEAPNTPAVSKEVFYVVSNTLTEALNTRGEGFSLLNMFGQQSAEAELEQRKDQLNQLKDERILVNKLNKNRVAALHYEPSSSGEDDNDDDGINSYAKSQDESTKIKKIPPNKQKTGKHTKVILAENYFFGKDDPRLKEGANFFHFDRANQISVEEYEPVRQRLNKLIKKKIIKTKKNLIGTGRKVKRNKRKM